MNMTTRVKFYKLVIRLLVMLIDSQYDHFDASPIGKDVNSFLKELS